MAYDEGFAQRVRDVLAGEDGITEKAMFGGLAFLADGRMALAVSGRDLLMVRADDETEERRLRREGVAQTVMRGRPMTGWLDVEHTLTDDDGALAELVRGAVAHARTLPPKV
ncbi:TfoX/Sxy family protein [Ornithinimicrobium flavum]|uniref:TfoX/Sxy family protein n=1 Tax=Ornithinimicrobium flavum TaxID=1288636 RepID=UPI00106FF1F7|nr:TfoX/Sxy family protein [Ornithinimicrobium flavum]